MAKEWKKHQTSILAEPLAFENMLSINAQLSPGYIAVLIMNNPKKIMCTT